MLRTGNTNCISWSGTETISPASTRPGLRSGDCRARVRAAARAFDSPFVARGCDDRPTGARAGLSWPVEASLGLSAPRSPECRRRAQLLQARGPRRSGDTIRFRTAATSSLEPENARPGSDLTFPASSVGRTGSAPWTTSGRKTPLDAINSRRRTRWNPFSANLDRRFGAGISRYAPGRHFFSQPGTSATDAKTR